jgi:V/A-type H+-transporting ATPase subunit C
VANLPLKLSGDPAYIYAVGRVRVREKRLLSSRQLNEAAEATSLGAAVEALREAGYESFGGSREGLELMLDGQNESLRRFLAESIPTGALTRFLLISTDYANLKAALVTQLSGRPSPLVNGGLTDPARYRGLIDGAEPDDLPDDLAGLARRLIEGWKQHRDSFLLQQAVDRAEFAHRQRLADEIGLEFLHRYMTLEADLINVEALARCLASPNPEELADSVFVEGGNLEPKRLIRLAKADDHAAIIDYISRTGFAQTAAPAFDGSPAGLSKLSAAGASLKLDFLRQARNAAFGSEPVIAYYLAKENEFALVRYLLICKLNGLSASQIATRLWETY